MLNTTPKSKPIQTQIQNFPTPIPTYLLHFHGSKNEYTTIKTIRTVRTSKLGHNDLVT